MTDPSFKPWAETAMRTQRLRQRAALRARSMPSYDDPPEYAQLLAESNAELFELQLHSRALSDEEGAR